MAEVQTEPASVTPQTPPPATPGEGDEAALKQAISMLANETLEKGADSHQETTSEEGVPTPQAEPEKPAESESVPKSEYYAKLSAMDRETRQLKQRLKEAEKAEKAQEALRAKAKEDPLGALQALDLDLDQILDGLATKDAQVGSTKMDPTKQPDETVKQYEQRIHQLEQNYKNEQTLRVLQQQASQMTSIVDADPEKYSLLHAAKPEGAIYTALQTKAHYMQQNDGRMPEDTEVLDLLEDHGRQVEQNRFKTLIGQKWFSDFVSQELTGAPKKGDKVGSEPAKAPENQKNFVETDTATPAPAELTDSDRMKLAVAELVKGQ